MIRPLGMYSAGAVFLSSGMVRQTIGKMDVETGNSKSQTNEQENPHSSKSKAVFCNQSKSTLGALITLCNFIIVHFY